MQVQTSRMWLRIGATLIGLGYGAAGIFSVYMSRHAPDAELAGRALWLGITLLIAATLAIGVSWLVQDLSNIWCIPAKRTKYRRIDDDA